MSKKCSKCGVTKSLSMFYKDIHSKDLLTSACKDCRNSYHEEYVSKNREIIYENNNRDTSRALSSWDNYIPKSTECQICSKTIYFNIRDINQAIHFDHSCGGTEAIGGKPTNWLRDHRCTEKNKAIWESCNFGLLCNTCNKSLPTIGRIEWLEKAINYSRIKTTKPITVSDLK